MRKIALIAAAVLMASPATATEVYSNNFDAENGGNSALNYNSFNGLTVTDGTVDLVRSGDYGIACAGGGGSCVDLDGSTSNSGLTSSNSFAFGAGDRVSLSWLFSGNQRQLPADSFNVRFGLDSVTSGTYGFNSSVFGSFSGAFSNDALSVSIAGIQPDFAFTDFEFYFVADNPGAVTFSFEDFGNDNIGIVIDDVSLNIGGAVPEPSTWAMMILGFGAVGAAARRRKSAAGLLEQ
jgi:hypothetical protein